MVASINAENLENMVCKVKPHRRSLHGEWLLSIAAQKMTTLWHIRAGAAGRPPHQVTSAISYIMLFMKIYLATKTN